MTKRIYTVYLALTAAAVMLCACQKGSDVAGQEEPSAQNLAGISEPTDPSSQEYTSTAGISPTTETEGSDMASVSGIPDPIAPNTSHEAETTIPTSSVIPDKPTQAPQTNGSKEATTSGTSASGMTGKVITTKFSRPTTVATATITTVAKSPWAYPYDVSEIIRECKAEIARVSARLGWVWDDSLTKERSSWDHPDNTILYTKYSDGYTFGNYVFDGNLKNYVFHELIPHYLKNQERYSIKRCKIWFEPLPDRSGDYNIYFLFWPDSA